MRRGVATGSGVQPDQDFLAAALARLEKLARETGGLLP
jgi:hypothetical protein